MKRNGGLCSAALLASLLVASTPSSAMAVNEFRSCQPQDSGLIAGRNQTTITLTPPPGYAVYQWCARAGSGIYRDTQFSTDPITLTFSVPVRYYTYSWAACDESNNFCL